MKGKALWEDFKKFAFKGNIVDMAVGVIVGGAFGKIVSSIVNDIVMPFFGFLTSGTDFKTLKWVLSPAVVENGTVVKAESAILYGNFIQNVVDFLIIAICIFFFLKVLTRARKKKEEEVIEEPKKPSEIDLLTEIRDLLKGEQESPAEDISDDKTTVE